MENISMIALWFIAIIQLVYIFSLTKYLSNFLKRFRISEGQAIQEHLKVGERVPLFREKDELNREVVMGDSKGRYTLLIFAEQDCMYCKEILSNLLDAKHKYNLRIIVISAVSLNENIKNKEFHFIVSKELFKNYMITTVPSIMLVDPSSYLLNKPETMHSHGLKIHLNNYFQGVPFKGKQNVQ